MVRVHLGPLKLWPVGQAVKTPPFHGGNTGSSPVRVIIFIRRITQVRLKGTVLKTVRRVKPCKGSNPLSSFFLNNIIAGWSSLVARRAHNPKVVGSNPAPAIKN
jgi:hypothetical protein